jgi:glycosyltransferase involved in cell wall biosynthesis
MKIGHLWYVTPLFGGAESWALGLSKALHQLGVESELVCWRREGLTTRRRFVRVLGGAISPHPDLMDALMNGAFMAEHLDEYDLLCAHHMPTFFPAVFAKSLHGSQVACILHSPPMGWRLSEEGLRSYRQVAEKSRQMYTVWKLFLPYADFFFTNSRWNQALYQRYEHLSPTPLLAGVDCDLFKPDARLRARFRDELKVDEETTVLFYASAAGRRKRHELLLRGVRALVKRGHRVQCILTCSKDRNVRDFHPLVQRIVAGLGLAASVQAFPATSEEVLLGLYNACDIYMHPANHEHLGMAILEAMAVGKPVVAQANGGVPELVTDGVEGFLFKSDSLRQMVDGIERLIGDDALRATTGARARTRAEGFNWLDVARRFLQAFS